MNNNDEKKPGIFSSLVGYTPTVMGVMYGGNQVFRTLSSNHASFSDAMHAGFRPSSTSMNAAIRVGDATAKAMMQRGSIKESAAILFKDSLVGGDADRFIRLGTSAFLATIHSPTSGLSRDVIEQHAQKAIDLANIALINPSRTGSLTDHMTSVLDSHGLTGKAARSLQHLDQRVKRDLNDFMLNAKVRKELPNFVESISNPAGAEAVRNRILGGRTLPDHIKLTTNTGIKVNGYEFVTATIQNMKNGLPGNNEFQMHIPIGKAARQGMMLTSQFSMFQLPMLGDAGKQRQVIDTVTDFMHQAPDLSFGQLQKRMMGEIEVLRSFGTQVYAQETAGERARRVIRRSTSYPESSIERTRKGIGGVFPKHELLRRAAQLNVEPAGPAVSIRGGVVEGNLLSRWYSGIEHMDWSSNPYQSFRDMNWVPSDRAVNSWGVKDAKGNSILDTNRAVAGPGGYFDRFKPVNPGKHWKRELHDGLGLIAPHQLQLHVVGDEAAKVLEKYGVAQDMGEAVMRKNWKDLLTFESMHNVEVSALGANASLVEKWKATGKPIALTAGTHLGHTRTGQFEIIPNRGRAYQELVGVEEVEGKIKFRIREVSSATEGTKLQQGGMGGPKVTLKFMNDERTDAIIGETLYGGYRRGLSPAKKQLVSNIDLVTSTTGVFKQGRYGLENQMAGALKYFVAGKMQRHGYLQDDAVRKSAQAFLLADNPVEWLRGQAAKTNTFEDFASSVASTARNLGVSNPDDLGLVFGASATAAEMKFNERLAPDIVRSAVAGAFGDRTEKIMASAQSGRFLTWAPAVVADTPWRGKGIEARAEIRSIDYLMEAGWKLGDRPVGEDLLRGLLSGAQVDDPTKLASLEHIDLAFRSATGQLPLSALGNDIQQMAMTRASLTNATDQAWFSGRGATLAIPEQLKAAAARVGMGDFLYVPGKSAMADLGYDDMDVAGMDDFRDAQGNLRKQHYQKFMNDSLKEIGEVLDSKSIEQQERVLKSYQTELGNHMRKASADVLKIRLGAGSGHVQAAGLADYGSLVNTGEWRSNPLLRQTATDILGEDLVQRFETGGYVTRSPRFLTMAEAKGRMEGVDFRKLGVTEEEFLTGKKGMIGLDWRNPTVMQTSMQPAEFWVAQGKKSANVPLMYTPVRYENITQDGVTRRIQVGAAPGQKLDFDKDHKMWKIITDENSVANLQADSAAWRGMEKEYTKNVIDRQVTARVLGQRMKYLGLQRSASDTFRAELIQQHGDELGERLYQQGLGAHRLATGKGVDRISKTVEEIMFAMGGPGGDESKNALMNIILSEAEETGTLKARKSAGMVTVADSLVDAFNSSPGGDFGAFSRVLKEELLGNDFAAATRYTHEGVEYSAGNIDELMTYGSERWGQYAGTEKQQLFNVLRTGRKMPVGEMISVSNMMLSGNVDASASSAVLGALRGNTSGKASMMAEAGIGSINSSLVEDGAAAAWKTMTKHIPGPVMLGLLGSAAAFTVMGNPGIEKSPLGPGVNHNMSPAVLGATGGSYSGAGQPQLSSPGPRSGGPSPTGQLSSPSAFISPMVNDVSVRVPRGDMSGIDYNGLSAVLRSVLPNGNITSRVEDSRRPLVPNDLHRDGF